MSEPRHDDVGGVLEELRAELDRIGEVVGPGEPATLDQLVERISSTRSVSTGHPFTIDRGGGLGPARGLIRRVLRKLVYWYVEPLAVDVRAFADAATSFAAASAARAADGDARHADLERFVAALRDRVGRAERALADRPPPQTRTEAAADPPPHPHSTP